MAFSWLANEGYQPLTNWDDPPSMGVPSRERSHIPPNGKRKIIGFKNAGDCRGYVASYRYASDNFGN